MWWGMATAYHTWLWPSHPSLFLFLTKSTFFFGSVDMWGETWIHVVFLSNPICWFCDQTQTRKGMDTSDGHMCECNLSLQCSHWTLTQFILLLSFITPPFPAYCFSFLLLPFKQFSPLPTAFSPFIPPVTPLNFPFTY